MPSPGQPFVLFDANDVNCGDVSELYLVSPGFAALVTAYNLPAGGTVSVEAVVTTDYRAARQGRVDGAQDVRSFRPTIGGAENWELDESHPQMIIALPGSYRFFLSDPELLVDSGLVVDARALELKLLPELGALVTR
jgi:hypothetical protein